jgi:hypothetical protein
MGSEVESHQFKNARIMAEDRKYAPREIKAQFVFAHHSINVSNY